MEIFLRVFGVFLRTKICSPEAAEFLQLGKLLETALDKSVFLTASVN